jgi:kynurenine formamidase
MKTRMKIRPVGALLVKLLTGVVLVEASAMPAVPQRYHFSKADVEKMMQSLSNWNRWGSNDQFGALNLITPEKRKAAAALVRSGVSISLARNVIKDRIGPSPPFEHRMVESGMTAGAVSSADIYSVQYHGYTQTHLDALCHIFYNGQMYNGYPQQDVTATGAKRLSVIQIKSGIFTRGVLIDLPRLFGSAYLKGTRAIYPEDLDAWEKKTGVRVQSGDAVFVRTGRWARLQAEGEWDIEKDSAGLHVSCMPWFKNRDIAVLASDLAADVMPSGVEGFRLPVHWVTIFTMGVPILDNCDLEAAGEFAAAHSRWEFLLTVSPLAVDGGTGSPVNPTATF